MVELIGNALHVGTYAVGDEKIIPLEHRIDAPDNSVLDLFEHIPTGFFVYKTMMLVDLGNVDHYCQSAAGNRMYIVTKAGIKFILECTFNDFVELYREYINQKQTMLSVE